MSGLDYQLAPIALREKLSFTKNGVGELVSLIRRTEPRVEGCVLISTCNRTELYLSCQLGEMPNPGEVLCRAAGQEYAPFAGAFLTRSGMDAARHLTEVAAGLQSQIWGEDQIVSQVKAAITIAREQNAADPVLETLFRTAVSAAKAVKTKVHLNQIPTSAASRAVEVLQRESGDLHGQKAIVIGNGEMGRLAAGLLREAGCQVTVTLRSYHHGETVVPAGCAVVPYEERFAALDGADILLSATTSPHYTVSRADLEGMQKPPRWAVDLAIPRDIQPEVDQVPGVTLYNVDTLGAELHPVAPPEVETILTHHLQRFRQWGDYRESLSALEQLKRDITQRVLESPEWGELDPRELTEFAVGRAVDLIAGGLKEKNLSVEDILRCDRKIRTHNGGRLDEEETHGRKPALSAVR